MNLAIFDNLPEGGAKRVVFEQIKFLRSKKHQVTYFTSLQASYFPFETLTKVERCSLSLNEGAGMKRPLTTWWSHQLLQKNYVALANTINLGGFDAVVVHHCRHTQAPWLLSYLTLPSLYFIEEPLRVVYEPRLHPINQLPFIKRGYTQLHRRMLQRVDRQNISKADCLMTNSGFTANNVKRFYGLSAQVNHLGVDTSVFKPDTKKTYNKRQLLFVGERNRLNGYPLLQRALRRLPDISVDYVTFDAAKLKLTDSQLAKKYANATATLCLAQREPFGLVALESMACGTPVIALNQGGYKETVLHNQTGLLIKPQLNELIQSIKVITKSRERDRLADNCRQRVLQHFSWQNHGKRLQEALQALLAE